MKNHRKANTKNFTSKKITKPGLMKGLGVLGLLRSCPGGTTRRCTDDDVRVGVIGHGGLFRAFYFARPMRGSGHV